VAKKAKKEAWQGKRPAPSVALPPAPPEPVKPAPLIKAPPLELDKLTDADIERVLKAIIFFDPRRLYNEDGTPIALQELDDATALAIAGLEVDDLWETDGDSARRISIGVSKRFKVGERIRAAETLWKKQGKMGGADDRQKDKRNLLTEYLAAISEPLK
jgi:hypothetical protein